MAIAGGRIIYIGTSQKARAHIGPGTKVYDLGGRMVMPGIIDGHFHGTRPTDCRMGYQGGTIPQIQARLQACLDAPDQAPLKNSNMRFEANNLFGESIEPPGTPLTRKDLDRLDTKRPIWVENADGHKFWMNSRAMANAGITKETPDPPAGVIGLRPAVVGGRASGDRRDAPRMGGAYRGRRQPHGDHLDLRPRRRRGGDRLLGGVAGPGKDDAARRSRSVGFVRARQRRRGRPRRQDRRS
jgi:hypothetical protein